MTDPKTPPAPTETRPPLQCCFKDCKTIGIPQEGFDFFSCEPCLTELERLIEEKYAEAARAAALEEPPKFNEVAQYCRRCGHPCSDAQRLHCDACGYPLRDLVAEKLAYDKLPSAPVAAPEREPAPRPQDETCVECGHTRAQHEARSDDCLMCGCTVYIKPAAASSPAARPQDEGEPELIDHEELLYPMATAARTEQPTPDDGYPCSNPTAPDDQLHCDRCGAMLHDHEAAAPVAVVEPQRERFIDAEMLLDTVKPYSSGPHPFIPYVVESDHPRFVRGTRLDWGFVSCALQDGYDLQIKAASDCATNLAIADYEERNGKCDWINWRRADSQRKEGAADGK